MDLDINSVVHRQNLFTTTLRIYLLRKINKYQSILLKNGIYLPEQSGNNDCIYTLVPRSQSFEDHIELVIGQKSASPSACKTFWKVGNRISTIKLFRWIYLIVQRTKAARILHHLDGISDPEIQVVIQSVGGEIAAAFEYQLCLLYGDLEIVKLAQHAGACIITYLNSADAHFAPENLLQAILEVKPHHSANRELLRTRSFSFNNQQVCLKWRLSQILKQPGLRMLDSDEAIRTKNTNLPENMEQSDAVQNDMDTGNKSTSEILMATENETNTSVHDLKLDNTDSTKETESMNTDITKRETRLDSDDEHVLGEELKPYGKCRRNISAVEMDYEKGEMTVTEYSVEVSDFSPIEHDTSKISEDCRTSIEEDLNSDISEDLCSVNSTYQLSRAVSPGIERTYDDFERTEPHNVAKSERNEATGDKNVDTKDTSGSINNIRNPKDPNLNVSDEPFENSNDEKIIKESTENGATEKEVQSGAFGDLHTQRDNVSNQTLPTQQSTHDITYFKRNPETSTNQPTLVNSTEEVSSSQTTCTYTKEDKCLKENSYPIPVQTSNIGQDGLREQQGSGGSEEHIRCFKHINDQTYQCYSLPSNHISADNDLVDCDTNLPPELTSDEITYSFYGCFTPYGAKCRPKVYGYRGPLHVWDEKKREYALIYNDTVTVTGKHKRQVTKSPHDAHQLYKPRTVCRHQI